MDERNHRIIATGIVFYLPDTLRVSGLAVIDRILSPHKSGEVLVRADGYAIRINSKTKIKFKAPITSLSGIAPNVWLTYRGSLHRDGIVIADSVILSPNVIDNREDKLLQKTDYDPSKVPDSSKQSDVKVLAFGVDPKKIPPYHDAAMQARIERIGKSLIPEYQKALPESDETKILFQFQLVDGPEWNNAWTLPSGVILVPRQIVEKMQNDSQLAAVLADAVSCALEKQTYREQPSDTKKAINEVGSLAGSWPLLGIVTLSKYGYAGNVYGANAPTARRNEEQRGRVALSLLHDAGYDLNEAPQAWWLLVAKDPNHVADSRMPNRAVYLYQVMGAVWQNEAKAPPSPAAGGSK